MGYLLHHLLSESAARHPDATAVRCGGESVTYASLERESNALAHALLERGIAPGDRVGLYVPKSIQAIVSVFGILKAGACYVPVEVSNPPPRLLEIANQCEMACLITSTVALERIAAHIQSPTTLKLALVIDGPGETTVPSLSCAPFSSMLIDQPDSPPDVRRTDQDLAYVLFTSGSTGRPKGVMLSHLNALTFVNWSLERFQIRPDDRLSNHAPLSFDLSVFDIFAGMGAGASVSLVPEGLARFPIRLAEYIERERITIWYSVPAILRMLLTHGRLEERDLSELRLILFAGEVFPVRSLRALMRALPRPRYFNLYGPTETNVCTYHAVEPISDDRSEPVPIGIPCENMEVFAIDERGALVSAPGQEGLLYARGSNVMRGYYGRREESDAAFIANPFSTGGGDRLYCTQDWVTLDRAGNFVFLGRRDHMVKTGGYRVELGEIEAALSEHPAVSEAAAIPVPDDLLGHRIRAVVATTDRSLTEQEIRRHCGTRLPKYMVPQDVVFREELPRTTNDKIDRSRLRGDLEISGRR